MFIDQSGAQREVNPYNENSPRFYAPPGSTLYVWNRSLSLLRRGTD